MSLSSFMLRCSARVTMRERSQYLCAQAGARSVVRAGSKLIAQMCRCRKVASRGGKGVWAGAHRMPRIETRRLRYSLAFTLAADCSAGSERSRSRSAEPKGGAKPPSLWQAASLQLQAGGPCEGVVAGISRREAAALPPSAGYLCHNRTEAKAA